MTSTADINKSAEAMIKEHGNDAVAVCKERVNRFYDRGNDEGSMRDQLETSSSTSIRRRTVLESAGTPVDQQMVAIATRLP